MLAYIIRRLLYAIPILLGVNLITFGLFFFTISPDAIARRMLGEKNIRPEQIEDWKREHGYHLPRLYNTQSRLTLASGLEVDGWPAQTAEAGFEVVTTNGHAHVVLKSEASAIALNPDGPPQAQLTLKGASAGAPFSATLTAMDAEGVAYTRTVEEAVKIPAAELGEAVVTATVAGAKGAEPKAVTGALVALTGEALTLVTDDDKARKQAAEQAAAKDDDAPKPDDAATPDDAPKPDDAAAVYQTVIPRKDIQAMTVKATRKAGGEAVEGALAAFGAAEGLEARVTRTDAAKVPYKDLAQVEAERGMVLGSLEDAKASAESGGEPYKLKSLRPFEGETTVVMATNGDERAYAAAEVTQTEGWGLGRLLTETIFWKKSMRLFVFDFGKSDRNNVDIGYQIKQRAPASLLIAVPTFFIGLFVNLVFSMLVAYARGTYLDFWGVFVCIMLMAISILFYIMFGQYLIGRILRLLPISGYDTGLHSLKFLMMPVVIGVIGGIGSGVRFYRTVFLDELGRDYIRTARSKGLSEENVLFKHALRNALIPILTSVVVTLPFLFMGSLVMEAFFAIPGLGSFTFDAITSGDFAIVRSMVFLSAVLYLSALIATDISYTIADPRIRLD